MHSMSFQLLWGQTKDEGGRVEQMASSGGINTQGDIRFCYWIKITFGFKYQIIFTPVYNKIGMSENTVVFRCVTV